MEAIEEPPERFRLFEDLQLEENPDKFVIRSKESPIQGFSIDRRSGDIIAPLGEEDDAPPDNCRTSIIYGVVGTIRLLAGTYVLVITSRKEVGTLLGFPIYRVASMRFLCCNEAVKRSTPQEKKDEAYFMALLKVIESTPGLYYSYEIDITLNLQRRFHLAEGWMRKPPWKQADPRFVWNKNLLEELIELKLDRFILPLLQGSFQTAELQLKGTLAITTLISRRCTRRLGTRMWRRGANMEGDTANFIETEQIVEAKGYKFSLLQVRGSIPLLWEQIVDLSYKPGLRIIEHDQVSEVVGRHFLDLSQRYGDTIAVDLTDKHGDEGKLSLAFSEQMQKLPNVSPADKVEKAGSERFAHRIGQRLGWYIAFDFHHICGNTRFENLEVLYEQLSTDFEMQRYFLVDAEGKILEEQRGVVRANCIDCLDRTNVTQSFLAQRSLDIQLQRIGLFSPAESISMFIEEYTTFRILWAEQGDEISLEYAGTPALKGDLVRYGRQTLVGTIKDGVSALSRYCLNNFHDGLRQDAIDLVSGHYINRYDISPLQPHGLDSLSYLPIASALLVGGLTLTSVTIHHAGRNTQQFVSSLVCAGAAAGMMALVKANGRQLCSRPRLCGLL